PVFAARPPMTLGLRGLGAFPSATRPRVLWCGVDGDVAALDDCARACTAALHLAGFPVDNRLYRAHCTAGRPRQPWPVHAHEQWTRLAEEEPTTPAFFADRAVLYESLAAPAGVRHVPRDALPFDTVRAAAVRGPLS
ncbi:MAG: hypothetical protein M3019_05100, partial [Candidatus Dormibacteraeota bacterium]|nr:hypothetical protein [Candidatus Dormibacteraeota bacterium]